MTSKVDNLIWMVWRNDQNQPFKIGELSKRAEKYYFKYDIDGVKNAEVFGFTPLTYFPRTDAEYFKEELFSSFLKRIPGQGKKDISAILKEYSLEKYDDLELLKRSGGKMSTDSFEFTSTSDDEPIILD